MGYYVETFGKCYQFIVKVEALIPYVTMLLITVTVCLTLVYIVRKSKEQG